MSVSPKEVIRRFYQEAWNERKLEVIDELVSESHALMSPNVSGPAVGPAAYKHRLPHSSRAFQICGLWLRTPFARKTKSWRPGRLRAHTKASFSESRQQTKRCR